MVGPYFFVEEGNDFHIRCTHPVTGQIMTPFSVTAVAPGTEDTLRGMMETIVNLCNDAVQLGIEASKLENFVISLHDSAPDQVN